MEKVWIVCLSVMTGSCLSGCWLTLDWTRAKVFLTGHREGRQFLVSVPVTNEQKTSEKCSIFFEFFVDTLAFVIENLCLVECCYVAQIEKDITILNTSEGALMQHLSINTVTVKWGNRRSSPLHWLFMSFHSQWPILLFSAAVPILMILLLCSCFSHLIS